MKRTTLVPVMLLGLFAIAGLFAGPSSARASDWKAAASDDAGTSTLSGKLYRNSADQNGAAPFLLLDKWNVVRGYVAAAPGVDLEASIGKQVSLQGTIHTLPGGEMPCMTCEKIVLADGETAATQRGAASHRSAALDVAPGPEAFSTAPMQESVNSTRAATAPARADVLPLREVVLEPQGNYSNPNYSNPNYSNNNYSNNNYSNNNYSNNNGQYQADPAPNRRPDPRRVRRSYVQRTAAQEAIPTPAPMPSAPGSAMPDPTADPMPMMENGRSHMPMADGEMIEGPMPGHMQGGCGCEGGNCESCGQGCDEGCGGCCEGSPCGTCCDDYDYAWGPHEPLFNIGPTGLWVKAEYLLWGESGMHVPPLVTTGSTADANPGAIGQPGTTVLFGGDTINNDGRSGFRFTAGAWINRCATVGIEGEWINLADEATDFRMWSSGNPVLTRPFTDSSVTPFENRAELVAFPRGNPNSLDGQVEVNAISHFYGTATRMLFVLCRQDGCWSDECSCSSYHDRYRMAFTAGYRYLYLQDQLGITENLTTTAGSIPGTEETGTEAFLINDTFNTRNSFNGAELGLKFEFQRNRWGFDIFPRVGLGDTHSVAMINGSTTTTDVTGAVSTTPGGLLTQPTNIGNHTVDNFSAVPEIDVNVNYQLTPHAKLVVGYTFLYWENVLRAGDQIDPVVNSTTLPNSPVAPTGDTSHPQFNAAETGFWAQGFNVGLDCRW